MISKAVVRTVISFMGYPLKMENDGVEVVSKIGGSWKKVKGEVVLVWCIRGRQGIARTRAFSPGFCALSRLIFWDGLFE
jgi:hypothetical protein